MNDTDQAKVAHENARKELAIRALSRRKVLYFTQLFTPGYMPGWVHQDVADHLDAFLTAVEQRKSPRLIIQLPPRTGKSQLVSRGFPAFVLGRHPDWEYISATYGQALADDLGRYVRSIVNDNLFHDIFPDLHISPASNAADRMDSMERGGYRAVAMGTALTGRGAHILGIDDPVKGREEADSELQRQRDWEWYSAVARTRLAPGGGVLLTMTRWHEDDLAGRLIEKAKNDPQADQWIVFTYPAIAECDEYGHDGELRRKKGEALHPARYDVHDYNKIRSSIDSRDWSALYMQSPAPPDGTFFKRDTFKWFAA